MKSPDERVVLGLNPGHGGFNYHDPSAVLVRGGQVLAAAEEERYTRQKGAPGVFPVHAVQHCLSVASAVGVEVAEIAVGYSPSRWSERWPTEVRKVAEAPAIQDLAKMGTAPGVQGVTRGRRAFIQAARMLLDATEAAGAWETDDVSAMRIAQYLPDDLSVPVRFVEHHRAHAASAFWPSGFREATVVVLDGVGEVTTASAWTGDISGLQPVRESVIPNSMGYLYAAVTEYLGFSAWDGEGKVMALAPYGHTNPKVFGQFDNICAVTEGGFEVGDFVIRCLGPGLALDTSRARMELARIFGRAPRAADEPLDDFHRDVAYAIQCILERAALAFTIDAIRITGVSDLCVAGGVFLNCRLNRYLRENARVGRFYAQPVAKDSGSALGAAWECACPPGAAGLPSLALGASITPEDMAEALARWQIPYALLDDAARSVARLLAAGAIIFWVDGAAEFGPRALGARSIVADPRDHLMADRINAVIKSRESWRPFGPSILQEYANEILEGYDGSVSTDFMIDSYLVRREWKSRLEAVIHPADGTTRPHLVRREVQPRYHELVAEFYRLTGVPALLNTSLNGQGEPIANSPREVVALFFTSQADALVCGNVIVAKDSEAIDSAALPLARIGWRQ